jgi:hypothetical protein
MVSVMRCWSWVCSAVPVVVQATDGSDQRAGGLQHALPRGEAIGARGEFVEGVEQRVEARANPHLARLHQQALDVLQLLAQGVQPCELARVGVDALLQHHLAHALHMLYNHARTDANVRVEGIFGRVGEVDAPSAEAWCVHIRDIVSRDLQPDLEGAQGACA